MASPLKLLLLTIATLLMAALAISNQSFWIDEGTAAVKALQPTLAQWWHALRIEGHSNLQLLPHLLYLWVWEKAFGASEISLRAANVPLLWGGLLAAIWGLRLQPRIASWFVLLALVNAFVWYYTGEARPYILLFAASCLALAPIAHAYDSPDRAVEERSWLPLLFAGLFLVAATSLVAVPWALCWLVAAIVIVGLPRFLHIVRARWITAGLFALGMTLLGAYYLWTLTLGARSSAAVGGTGAANLVFVLYEQLGLAGLGPGRNDLRELFASSLRPYSLLLVCGLALIALTTWHTLRALRRSLRGKRALHFIVLITVLPFVVVAVAGWLMHVRLLGRHFTPLLPIVIFGMALGVDQAWRSKKRAGAVLALSLIAVLLWSSLQVRFAARHQRDDYRSAARVATEAIAANKKVWWAADHSTGMYYKVPLHGFGSGHGAASLVNPSREMLSQMQAPDVIVLSKQDIYDVHGALDDYARSERFVLTETFQAFKIYERPRPHLPPLE
jgi:hypothetical protein